MRPRLLALFGLALLGCAAAGADRKGIRFWNLTSTTIVRLHLSPTGQDSWGPNQCENDKDGSVDHDERLPITGIGPGRYDAKLAGKDDRFCVVRNIDIKDGTIFSISDKDLTDCAE